MTLYRAPRHPSGIGLDLYCCAGGARAGYVRAGFQMIGVDKEPQPHYPGPFFQADAIEVLTMLILGATMGEIGWRSGPYAWVTLEDLDFIHASPPCQLFCMYRNLKSVRESTDANYLNMIPGTRKLLQGTGKPYIIENVTGARRELINPIQLCGTTFKTPVRRHRLFELGGWKLEEVPRCRHDLFTERIFPGSTNRPNGRTVCNIGEYRVPLPRQKECMQVDWDVTLHELSEMVPPVMTEFLGRELVKAIDEH